MRKFLKIVGFVFLGIIVLAVILTIVSPEVDDTDSTSVESAESDQAAEAAPEQEPEPTPTPIPWTAVTANEILTTYESNEIAGQQQFADRPLEVTGKITRPDYAPFSNDKRYLISLIPDELFAMVSLHCEIPVADTTTAWVAALADGDTVTVRGYIRDNMVLGILDLEECEPIAP